MYDRFQKHGRRPLQWRHYERSGVSNPRRFDCLLNHLFGCKSKKTSKLCVTGLCEGNPPVTGVFPSQRASDAENVSIWWRHCAFDSRFQKQNRTHCMVASKSIVALLQSLAKTFDIVVTSKSIFTDIVYPLHKTNGRRHCVVVSKNKIADIVQSLPKDGKRPINNCRVSLPKSWSVN